MKKQILSVFFTLFVCCFNQLTWADEVYELLVEGAINSEYFYTTATVADCDYTIGDVTYTKYIKFGGTAKVISDFTNSNKLIQYDARTTKTEVEFVVVNNSTGNDRNFYYSELVDTALTCAIETLPVVKSKSKTETSFISETRTSTNNNRRSFYFSVDNTGDVRILAIKITEKGTPLPMAGEAGYAISFNKSRLLAKANIPAKLDNMTLVTNVDYKVLTNGNTFVSIQNEGQYIHFYAPEKVKLTVSFDGNQTEDKTYFFYVAQSLDAHTNETNPKRNTSYDFFLSKGDWYIFSTPSKHIKVAALAFTEMEDIDPPTNYSISNDGKITFDQLQDCSYKFEMLDGNEVVISQENVESGTTITRPFLKGGDFTTKLYAVKQGVPSDAAEATWTLSDASIPQKDLPESEYCGYTLGTKDNEKIGMTWETDADGNINIYAVGVGAQWRSTAFKGVANFKVANLSASLYFEEQYEGDGSTVYTLRLKDGKKVALGETITFNGTVQWKINGTGEYYKTYGFAYTYGANCPESGLDTPTDLAITDDVLTFTGDEDATSYTAKIYYNGNMVDFLPVEPEGTTLPAPILTSMTYQVKVIAFGDGGAQSDESDGVQWTTTDHSKQKEELSGSEYCDYVFGDENKRAKMDWQTETTNGNINIDIKDMDGTNTTWRDNAFKGIEYFTVGKIPASEFFDIEYTIGTTCYQLKKKTGVTLGWGETITFTGTIQWKYTDGEGKPQNPYLQNQTYTYTYGTGCANLDAPTNFAITTGGVVTFEGVDGAEGYLVRVYDGENLKLEKPITSGETLVMYSFVDKTFNVCVVAYHGTVRSDESNKEEWTLKSAYLSQPSAYCEALMVKGDNSAVFDWQTNENGDVVITISESDDGEPGSTHFRAEAMSNEKLEQFTVNNEPAANYFTRQYTTDDVVYTLKLKDGVSLAPGATIVHTGYARYVSKKDGTNAYKDFGFTYTYGTRCVGYQVSADVNDATMGTAVVKQNGEEVTVVEGGTVQYIATANDTYEFVNWTQNGVEVSTDATYETKITATTRLVANFDYIRDVTYCHMPITTIQKKTLYMTIGQTQNEGEYKIMFEGSNEVTLTGIKNAGYQITGVYADWDPDGDAVMFDASRWTFSNVGYGSAWITFTLFGTKTWKDINVFNSPIYFNDATGGEQGYTGFPDRYRINWPNTCEDATAPVLTKYQVDVLDAHSVRFTLSATDELDKLISYTISRESEEDVVLTGANGVDVSTDITGLTPNTEYTFSIKASDGTNESDPIEVKVTPAGDVEAPTNVQLILKPLSLTDAKLTVSADDNYPGDLTYTITSGTLAESLVLQGAPSTPIVQMLTGLTAGETYNYSVIVTDAAGNSTEQPKVATLTMFSENILLNKPATAGSTEGGHGAAYAVDGDNDTYWGNFGKASIEEHNNWLAVNCNGIYDVSSVTITWSHFPEKAGFVLQKRLGAEEWQTIYTYTGDKYGENATQLIEFDEPIRMSDIRIINEDAAANKTYYMAIDEIAAFGEKVEDTEDPQNLSLSGEAISEESIRLTMYATDNSFGYLTYTVYVDNVAQTTTMPAPQATDVIYVIEGLTPGQTYEIYFQVKDASDNMSKSETISIATMEATGNVAYRRLAVAGSAEDARRAAFAVDGDNSTFWGNYGKTSETEPNNWLEVDLCGSYVVDRVSITWQHFPDNKNFLLQARDGEEEWTTILNYSGAFNKGQTQIIDLEQPTYSAFRVMNESTNYMAIYEFKAFGEGHVQIKDNANNDAHIAALNEQTLDVELDRTFIRDSYNYTLCLPFDMTAEQCLETFGEGYKLWAMGEAYKKSADMIYLPFSEVTAIEAGKPYIFCPAVGGADIENPTIAGVTINAAAPASVGNALATMTGIYSPSVVVASDYVLGSDNWLYQSAGNEMLGLRCYFTFGSSAPAGVSARAIFNRSDVVTDLEPIDGAQCTMHDGKYIIDGRFVIMRNNARYNAVGEPLNR